MPTVARLRVAMAAEVAAGGQDPQGHPQWVLSHRGSARGGALPLAICPQRQPRPSENFTPKGGYNPLPGLGVVAQNRLPVQDFNVDKCSPCQVSSVKCHRQGHQQPQLGWSTTPVPKAPLIPFIFHPGGETHPPILPTQLQKILQSKNWTCGNL